MHSAEQLVKIVVELAALPGENGWVEFKVDNADPQMIAEDIAALSNSARLAGRSFAYMVWGVDDDGHELVGTSFDPEAARVGNAELRNWLETQLKPAPISSSRPSRCRTVSERWCRPSSLLRTRPFSSRASSVRVGSYTKKLTDHTDYARRLWRELDSSPFETGTALESLSEDELAQLVVMSVGGIIDRWLLIHDDKAALDAVALLARSCASSLDPIGT